MRLSQHFSLAEFTRSQVAARMGREVIPESDVIHELRRLCIEVLEPLRHWYGSPMIITSGYRPAWLNEAIGGSRESAHMHGRAADYIVRGLSAIAAARHAERIAQIDMLPIHQVINEFGQWTHVAIARQGERPLRQMLTARYEGGAVRYIPGIVNGDRSA